MIVLDASVLIGHLNRDDAHHRRASDLLAGLDATERLATPGLTLAEVLAGPARAGDAILAVTVQAIERLGVAEVGWWEGAARQLAGLRAATRLKMPDCVVLGAAERHGARIATFDEALATAATRRGIGVLR